MIIKIEFDAFVFTGRYIYISVKLRNFTQSIFINFLLRNSFENKKNDIIRCKKIRIYI